jgi:hypothetical protein
MVISEKSMGAEAWLSEVDGLVVGMDRTRQVGLRHAAYRAAAIAVIKEYGPLYARMHREDPQRRQKSYRVSELFETGRLALEGYSVDQRAVAVGMVRDIRISVPSRFRNSCEPVVTREEFYIRDFRNYTTGVDPDISLENWSIPRGDYRLPSADVVTKDIYDKDLRQFGREISRLAVAAGVKLPMEVEKIHGANLAEVPRS